MISSPTMIMHSLNASARILAIGRAKTINDIDDFFIGRNGEGDHALDFVSTDGHNTKMNALFDRVNTDTRSNYKVLKEFKIDLSAPNNRGPHNVADLRKQPGMIGGESGYVNA